MKPSDIARLGPKARAQLEAALGLEAGPPRPRKRTERAPAATTMLRCMAPDCKFEDAHMATMDRHCDENNHHRYEAIL